MPDQTVRPHPDFDIPHHLVRARTTLWVTRALQSESVVAWMEEQGRLGNLVTNSEAPDWQRYQTALANWNAAMEAFDGWLNG